MLLRLICAIPLLCLCGTVIADANDGELLGFKIGDRINISDESMIEYDWNSEGVLGSTRIFVNTASKPDDLDLVLLRITPITHTVIAIGGRIQSSSVGESKRIQKRYHDILKLEYPDWEGQGSCSQDPALSARPIVRDLNGDLDYEDLGYEEHSCMLYNKKLIGPIYSLRVSYREYIKADSNNLHVWLSLEPGYQFSHDMHFGSDLREELDALEHEEIQQFKDLYLKNKYKNADKKGLN